MQKTSQKGYKETEKFEEAVSENVWPGCNPKCTFGVNT